MFVPILALPLAAHLIVVADNVPNLDVNPSCRGAVEAGYLAPSQDPLKNCLASEQRTRDDLDKKWTTFPAADRAECLLSIKGFAPTYTELVTCLEMKRDVRNIQKPADASPPSPMPAKRTR